MATNPHTGRGAQVSPTNRFSSTHAEPVVDDWYNAELENLDEPSKTVTEFIPDSSQSVVSENDSPDINFRYSLNPYRGCEHGCAYCYARPYHEYLGLNAGLDFEEKIFVKEQAPLLLRDFLCRAAWRPETIMFSGVTDCYQPCERQFQLTRGCLEVANEARQPISIITKNALVLRDLDLLRKMSARGTASVGISLTTLDADLARTLEPRTSTPQARLRAIRELSAAGVPVRVMTAPIIPGLNDSEIPALLAAASTAGARSANWTLLRLPLTVKPVFLDWLQRHRPLASDRITGLIRQMRDGELNSSKFGSRMRGQGIMAEQIAQTFNVFAKKYHLDRHLPPLDNSQFQPPRPRSGQLRLF